MSVWLGSKGCHPLLLGATNLHLPCGVNKIDNQSWEIMCFITHSPITSFNIFTDNSWNDTLWQMHFIWVFTGYIWPNSLNLWSRTVATGRQLFKMSPPVPSLYHDVATIITYPKFSTWRSSNFPPWLKSKGTRVSLAPRTRIGHISIRQ